MPVLGEERWETPLREDSRDAEEEPAAAGDHSEGFPGKPKKDWEEGSWWAGGGGGRGERLAIEATVKGGASGERVEEDAAAAAAGGGP